MSKTQNKKIGLFFGSFNPIHNGHLAIANYIAEYSDLNQIWFIVSPHNPLKEKKTLLADHHRFELVNLAVGDYPKFKVSNIEFSLPKPSYTIDTLTYLAEKYSGNSFVLIMGADNLHTFEKWKNYQEILKYYEIYIYPRPGYDEGKFKNHQKIKTIQAPQMEISSSFIRDALKKKKDVRFFMPEKVYNYIQEMHFYCKTMKDN